MKYFIVIILLATFAFDLFSQEPGPDLESIQREVNEEVKALQTRLQSSNSYESVGMEKVYIEFALDTARIEIFLSKKMDIEGTTLGMITLLIDAESEYDRLLNKYYKALLKKLSEDDQKTLMDAQTSWIRFRDNEIKLSQTLAKEEYSGGGSTQKVFLASDRLRITKQRVIDLFEHLVAVIND